jgi:hypothetical protein
MKRIFLAGLILLFSVSAFAQEEKPQRLFVNGYIKDLQSAFFLADKQFGLDTSFMDNQIHNRLNIRWNIHSSLRFQVELRNRIFWGDQPKSPGFIDQLDGANDVFDLSIGEAGPNGLAYHSMIDRLYLQYVKDQLEITLGRQRVNWGINTIWNPNDIFNAYAFTDFDYEERPGSDALRVRYYIGFASSIEIAAKAWNEDRDPVIALLGKFNKWNYDFQALAGWMESDLALGGGWAGSLGNIGFKGEFTYFHALEENDDHSFAGTVAFDYITGNSLFLNLGFLYNSNGLTQGSLLNLFNFELSAENLYPYRYSVLAQASYPFSPLISGGVAVIYSPSEAQAIFINPTISYSIASNWDFDLIGQIAFNDNGESFVSPVQALFLRFKWSF